jgi:hypothetical protein
METVNDPVIRSGAVRRHPTQDGGICGLCLGDFERRDPPAKRECLWRRMGDRLNRAQSAYGSEIS